jgi:hypothetical protein
MGIDADPDKVESLAPVLECDAAGVNWAVRPRETPVL